MSLNFFSFLDGEDESDIADQPTQPLPRKNVPMTTVDEAIARAKARIAAQRNEKRVCPVCVYYRESRGEHVEVGTALLRLCPDHMQAIEEADFQTRHVLRVQTRRAFNAYFLAPGYPHSEETDRIRRHLLRGLHDWSGDDECR